MGTKARRNQDPSFLLFLVKKESPNMGTKTCFRLIPKEIPKRIVKKESVSVKFSSVIHLTVDDYYLRGFGFISISV